MAELEVKISADIDALVKDLKTAESSLDGFGKDVDKSATSAAAGFKKTAKSTADATTTALEFNRVIQDAPFGIQGVANNLQQLTANFSQLSKNAGGATNAFKLLLKSLLGPAGILLAVSAITSALVVYGDTLFGASKETENFTKALGETRAAAQAEKATLNALVSVASTLSNSLRVRRQAIEELNSKYGSYLGNLSTENISTRQVTHSIDALNRSLLENARVRAAQTALEQTLADSFTRQIELQRQLTDLTPTLTTQIAQLAKENQNFKSIDTAASIESQVDALLELSKTLSPVQKQTALFALLSAGAFKTVNDELTALNAETARVSDTLTKSIGDATKAALAAQAAIVPSVDFEQIERDVAEFEERMLLEEAQDNLLFAQQELQKILDLGLEVPQAEEFNFLQGVEQGYLELLAFEKLAEQAEQSIADFNANLNTLLIDGVAATLTGAFASIGAALADGANAFEALGGALLAGFGGILVSLGELLIQTGVALLAAKLALSTINPAAALIAGAIAVAAGAAFASGAKSLSGQIGGSGSTASGGTNVSGSNTQSDNAQAFGPTDTNVVFEIKGNTLVGVLNNTTSANSRLGGNVALI